MASLEEVKGANMMKMKTSWMTLIGNWPKELRQLMVLQERAMAAIRALPGECREDFDYGYGLVDRRSH